MRAFVVETKHLSRGVMDFGWGNGYVVIPKGNPLHGLHYDEINDMGVEINGGLTFSCSVDKLSWKELLPEDKGGWVVGFDTAHSWDTLVMWPNEQSVMKEAENLKQQLHDICSK